MAPIAQLICANQYPILRIEAAGLVRRAPSAENVVRIDILAELVDVLPHEPHNRAVPQQPVLLLLAPRTVCRFVDVVALLEICFGRIVVRSAGQDREESRPVVEVLIQHRLAVACAGFQRTS